MEEISRKIRILIDLIESEKREIQHCMWGDLQQCYCELLDLEIAWLKNPCK